MSHSPNHNHRGLALVKMLISVTYTCDLCVCFLPRFELIPLIQRFGLFLKCRTAFTQYTLVRRNERRQLLLKPEMKGLYLQVKKLQQEVFLHCKASLKWK